MTSSSTNEQRLSDVLGRDAARVRKQNNREEMKTTQMAGEGVRADGPR